MAHLLYQHQRKGNLPILNVSEFVNMIESQEPQLQGFFNTLFQAMNPAGKNNQTQQMLKQKIMIICYQMVALRNKQISGTKTAIALFLLESGASVVCINTLANMGFCATYQTVYNMLERIANSHKSTVSTYINDHVSFLTIFYYSNNLKFNFKFIFFSLVIFLLAVLMIIITFMALEYHLQRQYHKLLIWLLYYLTMLIQYLFLIILQIIFLYIILMMLILQF